MPKILALINAREFPAADLVARQKPDIASLMIERAVEFYPTINENQDCVAVWQIAWHLIQKVRGNDPDEGDGELNKHGRFLDKGYEFEDTSRHRWQFIFEMALVEIAHAVHQHMCFQATGSFSMERNGSTGKRKAAAV